MTNSHRGIGIHRRGSFLGVLIPVLMMVSAVMFTKPPLARAATIPAPTSVSALGSGPRQITVRWTAPTSVVVTGFEIEVVKGGNTVVVVGSGTNSYVFENVAMGRWYSFRVRIRSGSSKSAYSPTTAELYVLKAGESAPPSTQTTAPGSVPMPSSLAVTVNATSANISWTAPPPRAGEKIGSYIATATPGPIVLTLSSTSTTAGFADLAPGVTYTFTVVAVRSDGQRSAALSSGPVTIAPPTTVAPPTTIAPPTTVVAPSTLAAPTTVPATAPLTSPPTPVASTTLPLRPLPVLPSVGLIPVTACTSRKWASSASGRPAQLTAGASAGVYVWFESGVWQIYTYSPPPATQFNATISTSSSHKLYPTYVEPVTDVVKAGTTKSTFAFSTSDDIDALRIASPCSRTISFSFFINGKPAPTSAIYFGAAGAHPLSPAFVLTR